MIVLRNPKNLYWTKTSSSQGSTYRITENKVKNNMKIMLREDSWLKGQKSSSQILKMSQSHATNIVKGPKFLLIWQQIHDKNSWKHYMLKAHSLVWDKILATENPLKLMKNAFYFILKTLLIRKVFNFFFWGGNYQHLLKLSCKTLAIISFEAFLKKEFWN